MKKITSLFMVAVFAASLAGCAQPNVVCGTKYEPYGLLDASEKHNPNIRYELSVGSIIISVLLAETIIVPIVALGFYLYEPVGPVLSEKGAIPSPSSSCK